MRDARHACKGRNQARRSEGVSKAIDEFRSFVSILTAQNTEHVNLPIARLHEERWLQPLELSQHPHPRPSFRILSAVRKHNAARVSVGLAVATVGDQPLPTTHT